MVNDSKLQLRYLIFFFFWLSIVQLSFFYDASSAESEIFANATNQARNNIEETGNQEETATSKSWNCRKILVG